ncbi:MAG: TrbI/VirB10 family protein [Cyanobacteria bacterium P01_D01_bin.115]
MGHPDNGKDTPNFDLLDPEDVGATVSGSTAPASEVATEPTPEEMAGWMGLDKSDSEPGSDATASSSDDPVTDDGEVEEVNSRHVDEDGKTKTPLWAHPVAKLAFVAVVAGSCLATVGLVVNTIQSAGRRDLAAPPTARRVEEEPPEDPMATALQNQGEEIGALKTQNALGNQQLAMDIQEEEGSEVSAAELLALRNQLEQRRQLQEAAQIDGKPSATVTNPPSVTPRPAPTSAPRAVPPSPPPSRIATSPPRSVAAAPRPAPVERLSPQEQLAMLSYGSYGSGSALPANTIAAAPIVSSVTPPSPTAAPQVETIEAVPAFSDGAPETLVVPGFDEATPKQADTTYAEEAAAILGHALVTVQSGTYAQAVLETPIYWAQDLANEQQSQRTALKLSEPLYGSRGEVALEAGTLLVAEVNVIAGSGLLQLHVTDVVITQDGQQQVMSIPHQNLVITGNEGQPLVAREIQNTGEIRAAEMQLAALGALGNVGELLNRPNSSTTVIGGDTSISTVENGAVNLLAGLLEGAADAVLPIEQARVENRIDDYESQPRIWHHDSHEPVMLFVAEEFTFQAD